MALKFLWTCETETLSGTHDFSTGDTTASALGGPVLDAVAARSGAKGIYINDPSSAMTYRFDPVSIFNGLAETGCLAISVLFPIALPAAHIAWITCRDTGGTEEVNLRVGPDGAALLRFNSVAGGGAQDITTAAGAVVVGKWSQLVGRWHATSNRRKIEVYNAEGALVGNTYSTAAYTKPIEATMIGSTIGFRLGVGGVDVSCYLDNAMVASVYNDALQYNATVSSYTEYDPLPRQKILMGRSLAA